MLLEAKKVLDRGDSVRHKGFTETQQRRPAMGRSFTPTYRVEYRTNNMHPNAPSNWLTYDYKRHGKPTAAKAEDMRKRLNTSFDRDGINFHVSKAAGVVLHVTSLKIVHQESTEVVAEATAPMFEVV
jgi:hypothetical protein